MTNLMRKTTNLIPNLRNCIVPNESYRVRLVTYLISDIKAQLSPYVGDWSRKGVYEEPSAPSCGGMLPSRGGI